MSESDSITVAANSVEQTAAGDTSPEPSTQSAGFSAITALVLALLATGLSIGLSVAAYFIWNEVQQLTGSQSTVTAQFEDRIVPLRSNLEGFKHTLEESLSAINQALQSDRRHIDERLSEQRQQFEQQLDGLADDQRNLGRQVSTLTELMGRSEQGWSLAEVEYLLRIANQRLQLQRDRKTAEQALMAADQRLQDLADSRFLSVREQIAKDLDAIRAVPAVDIEGISLSLTAALDSVDELAVAGSHYQPAAKAQTETAETRPTIRDWRELPKLLWSTLSGLFRIREHGEPVTPMLAPEHEFFLRENLRLQLSAARLALLRDDGAQYELILNTIQGWLQSYFADNDIKVNKLVEQLEQLKAIDTVPDLPDISGSLQALRRQAKLSKQQVSPTQLPHQPLPGATEPVLEQTSDEGSDQGAVS